MFSVESAQQNTSVGNLELSPRPAVHQSAPRKPQARENSAVAIKLRRGGGVVEVCYCRSYGNDARRMDGFSGRIPEKCSFFAFFGEISSLLLQYLEERHEIWLKREEEEREGPQNWPETEKLHQLVEMLTVQERAVSSRKLARAIK